jgi:hypothetical protein
MTQSPRWWARKAARVRSIASAGDTAASTASWSSTMSSGMARARRYPPAVPNRRPQLEIVAPAASPEEAAAVVAALERFMRDTAPPPAPAPPPRNPWLRAALLEQTGREPDGPTPWGDANPWG